MQRVVIEKPIVYPGRPSGARVLFGLTTIVEFLCGHSGIEVIEIAPAKVKKIATGKGNASKAMVQEAMEKIFPDQQIRNHNQADALAVLWAWEKEISGEKALTRVDEKGGE